MIVLIHFIISLVPVLAFLVALIFLDSYKLAPLRLILLTLLAGTVAAGMSFLANTFLMDSLGLSKMHYSRYMSPVVEESIKAGAAFFLVYTRRVGFLVDAAIYGFAIGTGFALVENVYYLLQQDTQSPALALAIVRGFGTAVMHGGVTSIAAIMAKDRIDRADANPAAALIVPLLTAIFLHSLFNHFILPPVLTTLAIVLLLPILVFVTFERGKQSVQQWLGSGMDRDIELLDLINSGDFSESRIGEYLQSLRQHFSSEVVVDIFCLLRNYVELSLNVKGAMLLRQSGFSPTLDDTTRAQFAELKHLESSVGTTGRLALKPILPSTGSELWQFYQISK